MIKVTPRTAYALALLTAFTVAKTGLDKVYNTPGPNEQDSAAIPTFALGTATAGAITVSTVAFNAQYFEPVMGDPIPEYKFELVGRAGEIKGEFEGWGTDEPKIRAQELVFEIFRPIEKA